MKKKSSGKRRKARRQDKTDWTDMVDALHGRCRNIEALAGLIEACDFEVTTPDVLQNAGALLSGEAGQLRELVREIEQKGIRP